MKKIILRILIGIGCVILAFVLLIAAVLWPKFANMKSEYVTAGMIRHTRDFVVKTSGQWPQTWQDLGHPDLSRYTHMDFTINPAAASESDIMKAITPQSQKYFTYPHAEADLKALHLGGDRHLTTGEEGAAAKMRKRRKERSLTVLRFLRFFAADVLRSC